MEMEKNWILANNQMQVIQWKNRLVPVHSRVDLSQAVVGPECLEVKIRIAGKIGF